MWQYPNNINGPFNIYSYYVGSNPLTSVNPTPIFPKINKTTYLSPFIYIVGDVTIRNNTYVGPFVSIRADEGTPFYIGSNCNFQDGVILHGLKNKHVEVNQRKYSIYIDEEVSCAHGSLIHGPCQIGRKVFVGFKSIVYHAVIGEGSFISSGAVVTGGVTLKPDSFVPPGAHIDNQKKADSLSKVPKNEEEFAREVQRVNQEFPSAYSIAFGKDRCSCGLSV
ncbi:carbonate dehydratase [Neobacillus sp. OS1-33]|uniref:carbonate dehydratase n=1 Tax=Neobacillus sp. OS1-33 TaxID=3070683 RepID=UPI0027E0AD3E|nr:carbonate dehydratase [Neobacillus sp. OS1-33]WML26132.1 carbonate dehydratase [Neobacillus sp. OS1-33]